MSFAIPACPALLAAYGVPWRAKACQSLDTQSADCTALKGYECRFSNAHALTLAHIPLGLFVAR